MTIQICRRPPPRIALMAGAAQAEDLTLCWAAWDPANALVELSARTSRPSPATR